MSAISIEVALARQVRRGDHVAVHYEAGNAFWMVECKVAASKRAKAGGLVHLKPLIEPTRAEQRLTPRVDSYACGVTAEVERAPACLVLNVSDHGLAIMSSRKYELGQDVQVRLLWNGLAWIGIATVKRLHRSKEGATLYGLRAHRDLIGAELQRGLERVTATLNFQLTIMRQMRTPCKT